MNATGRVKSPINNNAPPNNSSRPATPPSDARSIGCDAGAGKPRIFCMPCDMNMNATTIRSTLSSRGFHVSMKEAGSLIARSSPLRLDLRRCETTAA